MAFCGNPPTEDSVYPKTAAYDQRRASIARSDELGDLNGEAVVLSFPIRVYAA